RPKLTEHFTTAPLGHGYLEHDQIGPRGLGEDAFAAQEAYRLVAVADQAHSTANVSLVENLHCRTGVVQIVLNEQDFHRSADDRLPEQRLSHEFLSLNLSGTIPVPFFPAAHGVCRIPSRKQEPRLAMRDGVPAVRGESLCPNNTHPWDLGMQFSCQAVYSWS